MLCFLALRASLAAASVARGLVHDVGFEEIGIAAIGSGRVDL